MANNSFYFNKGLVSEKVAKLLKEHHFHEPCYYSLHGGYGSDKVVTTHNKAKDFNGPEYAHASTEWISVPYIQDALSWLDNLGVCIIQVFPLVYYGKVKFAFTPLVPRVKDEVGLQLSALLGDDPLYYDTRIEATDAALEVALTKPEIWTSTKHTI
jgi:hypothetical protein